MLSATCSLPPPPILTSHAMASIRALLHRPRRTLLLWIKSARLPPFPPPCSSRLDLAGDGPSKARADDVGSGSEAAGPPPPLPRTSASQRCGPWAWRRRGLVAPNHVEDKGGLEAEAGYGLEKQRKRRLAGPRRRQLPCSRWRADEEVDEEGHK
ncbi:hypothetical protein BS78_07G077900 [Paspalum vaginatum]|nr:hypothetical protein BS78_07G077900 [Paspalum vaginatum]